MSESPGYLVLIRKPAGIIGFVQTRDKYYSINPLGFEYAMLMEQDIRFAEEIICGVDSLVSQMTHQVDICEDDFDNCAHGWRFEDGLGIDQRTIMAVSEVVEMGDPGARLLNFSNPGILINDEPSGTEDDDNASVLRNAGCAVAGHRPSPEWAAILNAPNDVCCFLGQYIPACAFVIQPGTGTTEDNPIVYIVDSNGRIVETIFLEKAAASGEIDLSRYPSGLYFLRYVSGSIVQILKVMKL
jgi:hypothetical protein